MAYQVLIVEDDPMAQQLLAAYIQQSINYQLVETISSADLVDIYCARKKIDLILMDIHTAMHANGLDAAERIKKQYPKIKIIVVTSMVDPGHLKRAKEIGVDSFWYKDINREPFEILMDRTMIGEHVFPNTSPIIEFGKIRSCDLSDRELDVLRELATGAPNAVIAERLFVSENTVKSHLKNLIEKTGFNNRTELAVMAQKSGLVSV